MNDLKWLKRKFPVEGIDQFLPIVDEIREGLKLARFKNNFYTWTSIGEEYKQGTLCFIRRSNPINNWHRYPLIYCITKCREGLTASGFHSFDLHENDIIEEEVK